MIGFCEKSVSFNGGDVLGSQSGAINSSIFTQSGSNLKLRIHSSQEKSLSCNQVPEAGRTITVDLDFTNFEVKYFVDEAFAGSFDLTEAKESLLSGMI